MKKILVVDDDQDLLLMLKSFLTLNGYDPRVSMSCDEGLEIFYEFKPHLVLLDVNVGNADGREMCRKIKTGAEQQHIPVILISANNEALAAHGQYGANAAMEKPFNFAQLRNSIETFLASG